MVKQSLYRVISGRVFHYFVFLPFRFYMRDTQCGLKVFISKALKETVQKVNIFNCSFDVSVIFHAIEYGLRLIEVGINGIM
jgi:hypothetical protein